MNHAHHLPKSDNHTFNANITPWRSLALLAIGALAACTSPVLGVESRTLEADGIRTLNIDTATGDLTIHGDAEATGISAEVTVRGGERSDAMGALEFSLERAGDAGAHLSVALAGPARPFARADVVITLPSHLLITGSDSSGDALIEDVAGLDLQDSSGDLVARGIDGALRIEDGSGDLSIDAVRGDVTVFDDSGDLVIRDVTGDLDVEDASGDVTVDDVDGTFRISDDSGDIHVGRVGAFELVGDGSGDVHTAR